MAGHDRAEVLFNTKLSVCTVKIEWKAEFRHNSVLRKTVKSMEGPIRSDEPLAAKFFDTNSTKLGKVAGLLDKLYSCDYRRGSP